MRCVIVVIVIMIVTQLRSIDFYEEVNLPIDNEALLPKHKINPTTSATGPFNEDWTTSSLIHNQSLESPRYFWKTTKIQPG